MATPQAMEERDVAAEATLALISEARQRLAEAHTLPDIRRVMEAASVAADAAQRAAKLAQARRMAADVVDAANEAANDAAAVRLEAQAKAGELLREMSDCGDRVRRGSPGMKSQPATSLDDLGITKSESSRWQQVATVPADVRQEYVDEAKAAKAEVTTVGLLRHAQDKAADDRPPAGQRDAARRADMAAARKYLWSVYRGVVHAPETAPEPLVSLLGPGERRALLRAVDRFPQWVEKLKAELASQGVSEEER